MAILTTTSPEACWPWGLLAVNLTLAWLNFLGEIRHFPYLGVYIAMFFDILQTFLRFGCVFIIFVVAFGLGFHLLLVNQTPFETVEHSFLKTSVMMIGEFEYEGIFHNEKLLEFPALTYAFFMVFLGRFFGYFLSVNKLQITFFYPGTNDLPGT